MDTPAVVRRLVALRSRDRVDEGELKKMTDAQLRVRPEATLAAIVHGWFEFRSNGYPDADILREIEARRAQAYGAEPLPSDLTLESYARYRMRLEHPGEPALHETVWVMQAVQLVSDVLAREYGPRGQAPGLRSLDWRQTLALVFAALVFIVQVLHPAGRLLVTRPGLPPADPWHYGPLIGAGVVVVAGALAYCGPSRLGRWAFVLAIAVDVATIVAVAKLRG